jgi:hypothetical protein
LVVAETLPYWGGSCLLFRKFLAAVFEAPLQIEMPEDVFSVNPS